MSFLNTLKSMVGSGSPKLEVKLQKTDAQLLEAVKGVVTITGGDYVSDIDRILVYIVTSETIKDKEKTKENEEKLATISFNDYSLEAKEVITVPFQIRIPKGNLITSEAIKNYIKVKLDIPGKDVAGATEIFVK